MDFMKSLFIKKMHLINDTRDLLLQQIQESDFSPESGEGIRIVQQNKDYIQCHYINERIYNQDSYNIDIGEFEKFTYKRIDLVPLFIDLEVDTIDIVGNKAQAAKTLEFFGKMTKYKVPITDVQINFLKLMNACKYNGNQFIISKIKINDYTFFDNIIGDCSLNLADYARPLDIITKYEDKIATTVACLTYDDATVTIAFYKNGTVTIYKDIDSIDVELLKLLKQGL